MKLVSIILYMSGTVVLVGPITLAAEETAPYVWPWHSWHGHMPGFWWVFPLMMFIFMFFIFFIFSRGCGQWRWRENRERRHNNEGEPESALDILNKRYARGEIEKQEYEEKKTTIISSNR